ncbi:hypothetical protein BGZ65_010834, partial [Modicella reniformis]
MACIQIDDELVPDFSDPDQWENIKVLTGGTFEACQNNRMTALSCTTQFVTTSAVMHSGRHSGTIEAYHLDLSMDQIVPSRSLDNSGLCPKNPFIGPNRHDDRYFIERDLVIRIGKVAYSPRGN